MYAYSIFYGNLFNERHVPVNVSGASYTFLAYSAGVMPYVFWNTFEK